MVLNRRDSNIVPARSVLSSPSMAASPDVVATPPPPPASRTPPTATMESITGLDDTLEFMDDQNGSPPPPHQTEVDCAMVSPADSPISSNSGTLKAKKHSAKHGNNRRGHSPRGGEKASPSPPPSPELPHKLKKESSLPKVKADTVKVMEMFLKRRSKSLNDAVLTKEYFEREKRRKKARPSRNTVTVLQNHTGLHQETLATREGVVGTTSEVRMRDRNNSRTRLPRGHESYVWAMENAISVVEQHSGTDNIADDELSSPEEEEQGKSRSAPSTLRLHVRRVSEAEVREALESNGTMTLTRDVEHRKERKDVKRRKSILEKAKRIMRSPSTQRKTIVPADEGSGEFSTSGAKEEVHTEMKKTGFTSRLIKRTFTRKEAKHKSSSTEQHSSSQAVERRQSLEKSSSRGASEKRTSLERKRDNKSSESQSRLAGKNSSLSRSESRGSSEKRTSLERKKDNKSSDSHSKWAGKNGSLSRSESKEKHSKRWPFKRRSRKNVPTPTDESAAGASDSASVRDWPSSSDISSANALSLNEAERRKMLIDIRRGVHLRRSGNFSDTQIMVGQAPRTERPLSIPQPLRESAGSLASSEGSESRASRPTSLIFRERRAERSRRGLNDVMNLDDTTPGHIRRNVQTRELEYSMSLSMASDLETQGLEEDGQASTSRAQETTREPLRRISTASLGSSWTSSTWEEMSGASGSDVPFDQRSLDEQEEFFKRIADRLAEIGDQVVQEYQFESDSGARGEESATSRAKARFFAEGTQGAAGSSTGGASGSSSELTSLIGSRIRSTVDGLSRGRNPHHIPPEVIRRVITDQAYSTFQEAVQSLINRNPGMEEISQLALVFHFTKQACKLALAVGKKASSIKENSINYICHSFAAWIDSQGGWGVVVESDSEDSVNESEID